MSSRTLRVISFLNVRTTVTMQFLRDLVSCSLIGQPARFTEALPEQASFIGIIDTRNTFEVVSQGTHPPIRIYVQLAMIDKMSLAVKLEKIRSPKLQNQREVCTTGSLSVLLLTVAR